MLAPDAVETGVPPPEGMITDELGEVSVKVGILFRVEVADPPVSVKVSVAPAG